MPLSLNSKLESYDIGKCRSKSRHSLLWLGEAHSFYFAKGETARNRQGNRAIEAIIRLIKFYLQFH